MQPLLGILLVSHFGLCLRMLEVRVPDLVDVHDKATLSCKFDLEGGRLNSVKWYKEELEFFRYMPDNYPPIQTFSVDGVNLDAGKSNITMITLKPLEYKTSGLYRCEVSTEAPHFKIVFSHSNMTVLGLPQEDPVVYGVQPTYSVGEYVNVLCTSAPSNPPAKLDWFINGVKAEEWLLASIEPPTPPNPLGLKTRTLGLKFQADNGHFLGRGGTLSLACTATVAGLTRSREVTSRLAKLMNEKYAQEQLARSSGQSTSRALSSSSTVIIIVALIKFVTSSM